MITQANKQIFIFNQGYEITFLDYILVLITNLTLIFSSV